MEGTVDDAHAAATQVGVDHVAADLGAAGDLAFHLATGLYVSTPEPARQIG